jgi:hypothetical protein
MGSLNFFSVSHLSSCTVALGFTEMITRSRKKKVPEGREGLLGKADSVIAICEPNV